MKKYFKLLRINHYVKNVLIFMPLVFSGNFLYFDILIKSLLGFFAFSFTASIVYIVNDIHDIDFDKNHNNKKSRPIASGIISIKKAQWIVAALAVTATGVMFFTSKTFLPWTHLLTYAILNFAYSIKLKNIPLVDISIIVAGFVLRVAFGGAIINTPVSSWMHLTVMSMAFYLALGKRRNEMLRNGSASRFVLQLYTPEFLDKMMYVSMGLAVMFYSMWCVVPNEFVRENLLIWTVPVVFLICMKYSMNVECESSGDPAEIFFQDKILMGLVGIYALLLLSFFWISAHPYN